MSFNSEMCEMLGGIIAEAMEDPETFDYADRMYQQVFRSPESLKGSVILADNIQGDIDYFLGYLCVETYHPDDLERYLNDYDEWFKPRVIKEAPTREQGLELLKTAEFYETCNYKGEGEGFVLRTPETDQLPMFFAKYHYGGF